MKKLLILLALLPMTVFAEGLNGANHLVDSNVNRVSFIYDLARSGIILWWFSTH